MSNRTANRILTDVLEESYHGLLKNLAEEKYSLYYCYLRWRMDTREEIMFRVSPDVSLPNDLAELLFETSPTEDTWYEEKERIEALINDWLVLNAYEEGSATDAETDSDVERI